MYDLDLDMVGKIPTKTGEEVIFRLSEGNCAAGYCGILWENAENNGDFVELAITVTGNRPPGIRPNEVIFGVADKKSGKGAASKYAEYPRLYARSVARNVESLDSIACANGADENHGDASDCWGV